MHRDRTRARRHGGSVALSLLLGVFVAGFAAQAARATTAADICAGTPDPCIVSTTINVEDMSILNFGNRALRLGPSGRLQAGSGTMTIIARMVTVDTGGIISARGSGSTRGGVININADSMNIAGSLDVSGSPPGEIDVALDQNATITGLLDAHALARNESGGLITVAAATIAFSGNIDGRSGTEDALGADVELLATGNLNVAGTINVIGVDGGTITLEAGVGPGSGNVTLTSTSVLLADAINGPGGFGGGVDITATGNGIATGLINANGSISVTGSTAGEEIGGGSGGCIAINATGNVVLDNRNATLSVRGGGPDGDGGELELVSDEAAVIVGSQLDVSTPGIDGGGGAVAVDSIGPIVVLVSIAGFGGDGGEVALVSTGAGVAVEAGVTLDVSGRGIGSGGSICLESATLPGATPAAAVVSGTLNADGGGTAGEGGAIEVIGRDSTRVAGVASADGGLGGGIGGGVVVTAVAGPALVEGTLRARGRAGAGGSITVEGARIEVPGTIDVSGSGAGNNNTDIGLESTGPIIVSGTLNASSTPGAGGLVEVMSAGDVTIGGLLTADGGAQPGGRVSVLGCSVVLCGFNAEGCLGSTGTVRTLGPNGSNRITARDEAAIFGTMTAANQTGRNEVVVRPPTSQNATVLGTTTPAAALIGDSQLTRCPVCGNGIIEPPETCDDENTEDGDGCSANCRREGEVVPGDVNGDTLVNADDLRALAAEIFDGDGDAVANSGAPGADVNGDGRISAADFVELVTILAES